MKRTLIALTLSLLLASSPVLAEPSAEFLRIHVTWEKGESERELTVTGGDAPLAVAKRKTKEGALEGERPLQPRQIEALNGILRQGMGAVFLSPQGLPNSEHIPAPGSGTMHLEIHMANGRDLNIPYADIREEPVGRLLSNLLRIEAGVSEKQVLDTYLVELEEAFRESITHMVFDDTAQHGPRFLIDAAVRGPNMGRPFASVPSLLGALDAGHLKPFGATASTIKRKLLSTLTQVSQQQTRKRRVGVKIDTPRVHELEAQTLHRTLEELIYNLVAHVRVREVQFYVEPTWKATRRTLLNRTKIAVHSTVVRGGATWHLMVYRNASQGFQNFGWIRDQDLSVIPVTNHRHSDARPTGLSTVVPDPARACEGLIQGVK